MEVLPRFLAVGLLNTLVGFAAVAVGLFLGLGDYAANGLGFIVGFLFSYGMHRRWTFGVSTPVNPKEALRFGLAVGFSYLANLAVLFVALSAGYVGNPLAQAAAIGTYTCTFYLLSRYFVFRDSGAIAPLWVTARQTWPTAILAAASILAWLSFREIRLSHDLYWQFWIARQIIGGTKLYADIWELNPPLWFWSAMPLQSVAQYLDISWQSALIAEVLTLGAASAWLVTRLTDIDNAIDRAVCMLAQLWIVTLIPLSDIGQREHLALISSLPYAALIACRRDGKPVSLPMAIIVGLMGGYGFALKHYFVVIPLALELWLFLKLRRNWRPWRPELFILTVLAVAYAVAIVLVTPEFFTIILPMVGLAYDSYKVPSITLLGKPWVIFWLASAVYLYMWSKRQTNRNAIWQTSIITALAIVCGGFAFSYFLQQKGWYYHALPVTGVLALAVALTLVAQRKKLRLNALVGMMLLTPPASTILTPRPAALPIATQSEQLLRDVPRGETVFVATTVPRLAWPTIEQDGLIWPSRAFVLWMMPAVAQAEVSGSLDPHLASLSDQVLKATSHDIRCHPPVLIIFQRRPLAARGDVTFELEQFLLRDADFRRFMGRYYERENGPAIATVYKRLHPVAGLDDARCRTIY